MLASSRYLPLIASHHHSLVDDAALALIAALHQEAFDVHVLEVAVTVQQNALVRAVVQHLDHVRVDVLHARVARLRDRVAGQAEEELSWWVLHVNPTIQQYDDVGNGTGINGAHLQTTLSVREEEEKNNRVEAVTVEEGQEIAVACTFAGRS